ncbi:cysteine/glutathione ABC transporter membrane/ATP-binding component domain protein [Ostertagia ostertagi]
MTGDLRLLLRVLWLFRPYGWWMALGVLLACLTVLANVGLMAVAGGFIASMAIAGLADGMMNYFLPAAGIRLLAIIRTGGRYAERLISHEATFRLLARLRLWLFWKMEPLAPAGLQDHRGADLTSRIQSDIDTLQHAYLRLFTPIAVALIALVVIGTIIALYSGEAALWVLALLLVAGAIVPGLVLRATAAPAAAIVDTRAEMRIAVVDALQGMTDIKLFGDKQRLAALERTEPSQWRQSDPVFMEIDRQSAQLLLYERILAEIPADLEKFSRIRAMLATSDDRENQSLPKEFNALRYVTRYTDLFETEDDPFVHYLTHGRRERRTWSAPAELSFLSDTLKSQILLLDRYEKILNDSGDASKFHRIRAGVHGSPRARDLDLPRDFNPIRYCCKYPDLFEAEVDPFAHYLLHGRNEGRSWR